MQSLPVLYKKRIFEPYYNKWIHLPNDHMGIFHSEPGGKHASIASTKNDHRTIGCSSGLQFKVGQKLCIISESLFHSEKTQMGQILFCECIVENTVVCLIMINLQKMIYFHMALIDRSIGAP